MADGGPPLALVNLLVTCLGLTVIACLLGVALIFPDGRGSGPLKVFKQPEFADLSGSRVETKAKGSSRHEEVQVETEDQGSSRHEEVQVETEVKGGGSRPSEGVKVFKLQIVQTYPHDKQAFTQGLVYLGDDTLYESVGLYGKSNVRKVNLKTGAVLQSTANTKRDFGEGLAYYQGYFWQLIWKNQTVYQYDPDTLRLVGSHSTPRSFQYVDGWGLTSSSDGVSQPFASSRVPSHEKLYATDSGTKLYQLKFSDGQFQLVNSVTIQTQEGTPLQMANELELVADDELWANIFGKDCIAKIDPQTGKVFGWILAQNLRKEVHVRPGDVFNGIAYDRQRQRLFVTGKNWEKMFEVKLVPADDVSHDDVQQICVPTSNIFHPRIPGLPRLR